MSLKNIIKNFLSLFGIVFVLHSCQDSIPVGFELLDDKILSLGIMDTFDLSTTTIEGQRIITYTPNLDNRTYFLGQTKDDVFGKTSAEIYMRFQFNTNKPPYKSQPDRIFDSLVLLLQYDANATYGNAQGLQDIKVFELDELYTVSDTIYSDKEFKILPQPLAEWNKKVSPKDSVTVVNHLTQKTEKLAPHLRIKFRDDFGKALLNNDLVNDNDTLFRDYFNGINIKSIPSDNQSMLYGFNLNTQELITGNKLNKLVMYYHVKSADTIIRKQYDYIINTATGNKFSHDLTSSQVLKVIQKVDSSDQTTYIQAMGGVKTIISFNDLKKLKGTIINKAELELTVKNPDGLSGSYEAPNQINARYKDKDGRLVLIDDILNITTWNQVFGGTLDKTNNIRKYKLNITNHIKKAVETDGFNSGLYLGIFGEAELPNRAAIYGAKSPINPVKLSIIFTKK